jgi:DNA topoisomerase-2
MKKIEDKYRVLNHIDHILLRPQTYLGSNKPHTSSKWLFKDGKMVKEEITYVPSFIKIFDEILMNSVDESKRNNQLNRIEVIVDEKTGKISVKDNGGIEVVIHKVHKKYVPEVIFGNLMSGSNYDDTESRTGAGTNGYGAKLTNIFSKEFNISTSDGSNSFSQTFRKNMRERDVPVIKKSKLKFTQITYTPDYEKFGLNGLDKSHLAMIHKRVIDIAGCNPKIKVYFNGELINFKSFEDYIKLYKSDYYYESSKDMNWSVGIAPSDDGYQQISFVNTTDTYDGGTHVDYILNQVIVELRDFFQKKHKVDIKPSELKSHIFFFLNATVVNPSFSSQTKEKLITEIKDFGTTYQISDKLVKWVLKSEIVNSILDWIQKKKSADDSKLARELNKNISKLKVDKLIDAKGKDRWKCSLAIFEGDSAISGFRKYRNSQLQGGFTLRGKFMNVNDITTKKLSENSEAVGLMSAIGLRIGKKAEIKDLRYGRILIYTDADCLDPETIIITKGGEKKISDITYDDLILTHTGSYKKVKNIIQKDVSRYMKIIINGNTIICSENHKFMIFRDGEVMEVEAKNIKYSDHFLIKR